MFNKSTNQEIREILTKFKIEATYASGKYVLLVGDKRIEASTWGRAIDDAYEQVYLPTVGQVQPGEGAGFNGETNEVHKETSNH